MITVYRIYFGRAWQDTGTEAKLRSLFDAVPEFLYSAATCERVADEPQLASEQRAAVRVAMTHAHVAVMPAFDHPDVQTWTDDEIAIARRGFRWRVPILGIIADSGAAANGAVVRAADRVVRADGPEVARAILEIATAAQAERRSDIERLARREIGVAGVPATGQADEVPGRPLPFAEIADAFHQFRAGPEHRQN